jgi:hypothetical protein
MTIFVPEISFAFSAKEAEFSKELSPDRQDSADPALDPMHIVRTAPEACSPFGTSIICLSESSEF